MFDNLEELNNLSEKEKEVALKILNEYSSNGFSNTYNKLLLDDYKEMPVDIITFIKDYRYLGKAWHTSTGKCKLYPYWEEKLKLLFPDPYTTNYNNFIESGARGIGKSEIAVTIGLYLMHRLMCLKNPHDFYDLKPTEKFAFAFMNITITLAEDIGISKFQETVQLSPWFMDRGYISGRDIKIWNPPDFINIIIGSQSSHLIGQAIMFAFFDEISFIKNMDIEKQKKIATDMMDTAIGGMKTRFIHNGKNPTILVLASSKRTEKSFLEEHMRKKLKEEDESVIIIDEPVWNIKPKDTYSGKTFYVAQGNRFLVSEIIPDNDTDLKSWKDKGYNILKVPIEFKSDFRDDIDRALCDFAGISSSELMKYISGPRWLACRDLTYQNPFIKEIIEVGNAVDDTTQYYDFFDLSKVDRKYIDRPLFIHLDMSLSGDKTGIAGVWILGKKRSSENENSSEELYFKLAFHVSIKAPRGYQVSFAKNREFIYWLRNTAGFAIKGITSDTYQNAALGQDFLSKGYPYSVLSVDRVDNTRICPPYAYFKNAIYEQRILVYDNENLTSEVLQLERNESSGKVDHPDGGAKDASDAVCGALYNASLHGDEFAFYYGEDIENTIAVSGQNSELTMKQVQIDMQEELNKLFNPLDKEMSSNNLENQSLLDFGFGKATHNFNMAYLTQGIIV